MEVKMFKIEDIKLISDVEFDKMVDLERSWRDNELNKADVGYNKSIDNHTGNSELWSQYRSELRDWPANSDFPNQDKRPVAPN